jgi:hypothetical protein
MKTVNTVKTKERAMEILQMWLTDSLTEDNLSANSTIREVTARCECGETQALQAFYEGGNEIATVAYCDCCGDDNIFTKYVLNVI